MKKTIILSLAAVLADITLAATTITINRVQQRYPWNGLVDIDYTVAGIEKNPLDYSIAITVTIDGTDYAASNFLQCAACDLPTADGAHRVTWKTADDGMTRTGSVVSVKAEITCSPVTEAIADYAIIDISSGASSTEYPVRYVKGSQILPSNFNVDTYKTTKIVLKKIPAQTTFKINSKWVRFTKSYFMGLFEITQKQYKLVTNLNPSGHTSGSTYTASLRPVDKMYYSLINANDGFLARLNARAKYHANAVTGFLLPTEAQWECACRAGTTTTYTFGTSDAALGNYAWYTSNSNTTMPVGTRLPNPWGFYDMYGNVYELCDDYYAPTYPAGGTTEATAAEDPWIEAFNGNTPKPMRGGSRRENSTRCTSVYRMGVSATSPYNNYGGDHVGFRISKTLP